ncbi:MAG: mechanosensitive ion channel family protein [Halodesulfurarchaeum sp.]
MALPPPADWPTLLLESGWLYAFLVLVASWYLGRALVRFLSRRVARRFVRPSITRTILRSIRLVVLVIGVLVAFRLIGLPITSIALSVTVFSAVLGLILAPIVGSIINGLFVLADQPYEIGDMIELGDVDRRGFVEDITLRYTKIFTVDNTFMVIPNSTIRERDVINFSAEDERTRLSLSVGMTYEGDLDEARRILEESAAEVPGVIDSGPDIRIGSARYPAAPTALVQSFGDHGITLELRYWAEEPYRIPTIRSNVHDAIWSEFEAADDVSIAYPHQHHVFDETSGEARVKIEENARDRT